MSDTSSPQPLNERPPVIVVMGHIDHGKSTLLDYIRQENTVSKEAGGITQHISAYEILHDDKEGNKKRITFIDTPGHEAFGKIRSRGAQVGDIAVLVVAADDGVSVQTKEALKAILDANIPYVVAINKIDKPGADVNKAIASLLENEIYLEGYGGSIPWNALSAKTGQGVSELLDTLLLVAEIEEFKMDTTLPGEGTIIETKVDTQAGISATLLVKNGSLASGQAIWSQGAIAPLRIMRDYAGRHIQSAIPSSPIQVIGFNTLPPVGSVFKTFKNKKEAQQYDENYNHIKPALIDISSDAEVLVPIILKSDVSGSLEALFHEIGKINIPRVAPLFVDSGIGDITESDVRTLSGSEQPIIIGFNVKIDSRARDSIERFNITVKTFTIIYELAEWMESELRKRSPKIKIERIIGSAKILKTFNRAKTSQIIGGKVVSGTIDHKGRFHIVRREERIGIGVIEGIQSQKVETKQVQEGNEFGAMIESRIDLAPGDIIETFIIESEEIT
jgi:translation initiation factor IF-2